MIATRVVCARCGRDKAPVGRSIPLPMCGGALCERDLCSGYAEEPFPDCRWPGEEVCGPGCTR